MSRYFKGFSLSTHAKGLGWTFIFTIGISAALYWKHVPVHDSNYSLETFLLTYSSFLETGRFAWWFPLVEFGQPSSFYLVTFLSPVQWLVAIVGYLLRIDRPLDLFLISLIIEVYISLAGTYLLGKMLLARRESVAFLVVASGLTTQFLYQISFDFRVYAWIPWITLLALRFAKRGEIRDLIVLGIVMVISLFGNSPYLAPVFFYLAVFLVGFTWIATGRASLREIRRSLLTRSNLLLTLIGVVILFAYFWCAFKIFDGQTVLPTQRSAKDLTVSRDVFLSYGYDPDIRRFLEMLYAVPVNPDVRIFIGYIPIALMLVALVFGRDLVVFGFFGFALGIVSLAVADLTPVPELLYNLLPGMKFYRHIGLLLGVAKVYFLLIAAMGLDILSLSPERRLSKGSRDAVFLAWVSAFLIVLSLGLDFFYGGRLPYPGGWLSEKITSPGQIHWVSVIIAALLGLLCLRSVYGNGTIGLTLIVVLAAVELGSYAYYLQKKEDFRNGVAYEFYNHLHPPRFSWWRELRLPPLAGMMPHWGAVYGIRGQVLGVDSCAPVGRIDFKTDGLQRLVEARFGLPDPKRKVVGDVSEQMLVDPVFRAVVGCEVDASQGTDSRILELDGWTDPRGHPSDFALSETSRIWRSSLPAESPKILQISLSRPAQVFGLALMPEDNHPEAAPGRFELFQRKKRREWESLLKTESVSGWEKGVWRYFPLHAVGESAEFRLAIYASGDPHVLLLKGIRLIASPAKLQLAPAVSAAGSVQVAMERVHQHGAGPYVTVLSCPDGKDAHCPDMLKDAENAVSQGTVEVVKYDANRLSARVSVDRPPGGWLVYRDADHPGWSATVDGSPAPIVQADLAFKAVRIPQGTHEVSFEFASTSHFAWMYGLAMVLANGVIVVGGWLLVFEQKGTRKRRR